MRALVAVILGLLEAFRYVGATTCPLEDEFLVFETKKHILTKLGLLEEPRNPLNSTVVVPEDFLNEGKAIEEVNKLEPPPRPCADLDFLKRETTIIYTEKVIEYRPKHSKLRTASGVSCTSDTSVNFVKSYRMKFKVNFTNADEIIKAELHLRKFHLYLNNTRKRSPRDRVDVNLFTLPNDDFKDGKPDYITTQFLDADSISGLAVFNVTEAVSRWLETSDGKQSGEIVLDVVFRCPQDMAIFVPNFQFFSDKATLLITTSQNNNEGLPSQRKKRQNDDDSDLPFCDSKKVTCCLKKFKINFEQHLNWTWVLYPKEMSFNYCAGLCPISEVSNFHSQFLGTLRTRSNNPTAAGDPCCVPNTYRSRTIAMIVRGVFTHIKLPDIEATSCACR